MDRAAKAREVAKALLKAETPLLVTHKNPDGDAIGSCLALAYVLSGLGKKVEMVNIDGVPDALKWLEGSHLVEKSPKPGVDHDLLVLMDCNEFFRTGFDPHIFDKIPEILVIDHHPTDSGAAPAGLLDHTASATGLLVFEVIKGLNVKVTPSVAMDLYVALHTDTGGFRFSNTDADSFRIAAELVDLGASPSDAAVMLLERENAARMKLLGLTLGTLEVTASGRIAYCHVTGEMFTSTKTRDEDTDGFVNYPRSVTGVEVAMLFKEKGPGIWRVTMRSRGLMDVSAVARDFGGGGHKGASGATLEGDFEGVRDRVVLRVIRGLEEAELL